MKLFTLDEAQALVPVLESLLKRGIEAKHAAEQINEELQKLTQRIFVSGGMHVDVAKVGRQRTEMEAHIQRAKDAVQEIDAIGVQVKDLDIGLLDFPCKVEDEVVLLCWKMGEARSPTGIRWSPDLRGASLWMTASRAVRGVASRKSRTKSPAAPAPARK